MLIWAKSKNIDLNTLQAPRPDTTLVLQDGNVNLAQDKQSSSYYSPCVILIKLQTLPKESPPELCASSPA